MVPNRTNETTALIIKGRVNIFSSLPWEVTSWPFLRKIFLKVTSRSIPQFLAFHKLSPGFPDFPIPFSYTFKLLKPAFGWFSANLSGSGCWIMGINMIMVMINIWYRRLTYYVLSHKHESSQWNMPGKLYFPDILSLMPSKMVHTFLLYLYFFFVSVFLFLVLLTFVCDCAIPTTDFRNRNIELGMIEEIEFPTPARFILSPTDRLWRRFETIWNFCFQSMDHS